MSGPGLARGRGGQTGDPDGRRRSCGVAGHRPRSAPPLRRRVPDRPDDVGRRSAERADRVRAAGPAGGADRVGSAHARDDRRRVPRAGPRARSGRPSSCCSRPTPTPTSRSRPSTTSGSTTTCLKPWDPPEERLYPVLDDLLERLAGGAPRRRAAGSGWSATAGRSGATTSRPSSPATTSPTAGSTSSTTRRPSGCRSRRRRARPTCPSCWSPTASRCGRHPCSMLADALGLRTIAEQPLYDLCIVGGGPRRSGRRRVRRVRGARRPSSSSGRHRAGRRARARRSRTTSASPRGVSGADLTHRAVAQARRFGAEMVLARDVVGFEARGPVRAVRLGDGAEVEARTVLVATGVSYRRLDAPGLEELGGPRGVLRRHRQRGPVVRGRRRLHRRRGQLGRPGRAQPRPLRPAGRPARALRLAGEVDVAVPRRADPCRRQHRGAAADRGRRPATATITSRRSPSPTAPPAPKEEVATNWLFVFIGASPAHRLARRRRRPRRARASSSPARTCSRPRRGPTVAAGPTAVRRSRPACPACSRPATSGSTR